MGNGRKILTKNRKARHEYHIMNSLEVGLVLVGSEIKSIRAGKVNISGSYASFDENGELWVHHMHIAEYPEARDNHDPYRDRKLLAHGSQLRRIRRMVQEKGHTLIPLDVHLSDGRAKLELGFCRGKKQYDKRVEIAKRDMELRMRREIKRETRGHE